jgi:hypothetical protein
MSWAVVSTTGHSAYSATIRRAAAGSIFSFRVLLS